MKTINDVKDKKDKLAANTIKYLSRKPASLEARLEVFLLERPKGVVWVPPGMNYFCFFGLIFWTPFRSTFS